MDHSEHYDHSHHEMAENPLREYLKLASVITGITILAVLLAVRDHWSWTHFLDYFMGSFFLVFGFFKLLNLKMFAHGFSSYDILAKKTVYYAYAYPFIQLLFAALYLSGNTSAWLDGVVLLISLVSSVGVLQEMGSKIKCACLGNFINLPLTKVSFIEDFGMALMAFSMLLLR